MTEREIQTTGVQMLRKMGCQVYVTSQRRASSVTKGVPDVIVFTRTEVFFWEAKAPKGRVTPEQQAFADACRRTHTGYVCGGLDAVTHYVLNVAQAA